MAIVRLTEVILKMKGSLYYSTHLYLHLIVKTSIVYIEYSRSVSRSGPLGSNQSFSQPRSYISLILLAKDKISPEFSFPKWSIPTNLSQTSVSSFGHSGKSSTGEIPSLPLTKSTCRVLNASHNMHMSRRGHAPGQHPHELSRSTFSIAKRPLVEQCERKQSVGVVRPI